MQLSISLAFILVTFQGLHGQSARELAKTMFTKTKQIKTLTYTIKKQERIDGEMIRQISFVKLVRQPFKVYIKQDFPNKGMEALYVSGTNNNKALVNPNGFPWFNIRLDPYGSLMRANQHHTIHRSGFDYVVSILEYLFDKYDTIIDTMVKKQGTVICDGRACYVIMFSNPYFKFFDYTVRHGETLPAISERTKLSEYMILEKNEAVDDYEDVNSGQIIEIPNDYSPKMIIYIDKQRMIPLVMKIYDDQGLYEQYEYINVVVNPFFKPEEFTKEYKEYGF
ncbi:MAG: DUF1571 domain-containing protein [Cytophagales bacterium]|nr:DUF1571 domain-containing protein [Cytophagales bacterium]